MDLSSLKASLTKPNSLEIEATKIRNYESDIQIDARDRPTDQSQPGANHEAENQSKYMNVHNVKQDSSKGDGEATVEIVPDENLDSDPQ